MKSKLDPVDYEAMKGCELDPLRYGPKNLYAFLAEVGHILYNRFQCRVRYGVQGLKHSHAIPFGYIQLKRNRFYVSLDTQQDNAEFVAKKIHKEDKTSCKLASVTVFQSIDIRPMNTVARFKLARDIRRILEC